MRRVFIDIGACRGESVAFFREHYKDADRFEIHCFEPLPDNFKVLKTVPGIIAINAAAWTGDGVIEFYPGTSLKSGSLYRDKMRGGVSPNKKIIVKAVDIAKYIRKHFSPDDEIWFKSNSEGAECEILPHLKINGLFGWVDRWYINWHFGSIPSANKKMNELQAMLPGVKPFGSVTKTLPL